MKLPAPSRPPVDRQAAARAVNDFLRALGYQLEGDLAGTGQRVADAWADDLLEGEHTDAAAVLRMGSFEIPTEQHSLVVVRDISVTTLCPHHLLPAQGSAIVAYLPSGRIAGFGAVAQVVDALSRRLTLQEHIGTAVVSLLVDELGARGALCRLALRHACLSVRGARKESALVQTVAVAGSLVEGGPDRDLALAALRESP
jgi:GTP cyclohydrolase I